MRRLNLVFSLILVVLTSCSSIDCPVNNTPYCNYVLRGEITTLTDTLFITTSGWAGEAIPVFDKKVNVDEFHLPMSYANEADTLFFHLTKANSATRTDTVTVTKTNQPHFESVDCPPCYFHTITGVKYTHHSIDSIIISKPKVDYDTTVENLLIYFKSVD